MQMNKKMNYFAAIPVWGVVILMLWLFVKKVKGEINHKFNFYFISSAIFGFLSLIVVYLLLFFFDTIFHVDLFFEKYGFLLVIILGGYLMNLFSFVLVNKKWEDMQEKHG